MPPETTAPHASRILTATLIGVCALCALVYFGLDTLRRVSATQPTSTVTDLFTTSSEDADSLPGTALVPFEQTKITLAPGIAQKFSLDEITNIGDVQKEFGVVFSPQDLEKLEKNKFLIKNVLDTNLTPVRVGDALREFPALYASIEGESDYKARTPAHAPFISADSMTHLYSVLSLELLKETENSYLYPQVYATTKKLYDDVSVQVATATDEQTRQESQKVRRYFAVPYALLATVQAPLDAKAYWNSEESNTMSLEDMQRAHNKKDADVDTEAHVVAFVKNLHLDAESERAVIADIALIYSTPPKAIPNIFKEEYTHIPGDIQFSVPFSLFTVRGSYTSSSLRRQYFRAVQWYQQIPFFTRSPELTTYATRIGELMYTHPELRAEYTSLSSFLSQLVGDSDDLDVEDYADAVGTLGAEAFVPEKLLPFLDSKKPPARIKGLPATYSTVGVVTRKEVIDATRGMRFFSQKFIPDSYWTGMLTQGDEAGDVAGMKLPRSASSLQVMSILGSEYARAQLPKLLFYEEHKEAIDTRLMQLAQESHNWGTGYWSSNQVTSILWSISGMFEWGQDNRAQLPQFMQSPVWGAKTLLTASGFWTELRHTNILYAKQSFAEMGGGGDADTCDIRVIPKPTYGYVEPQPDAYDRLHYAARMLYAEYSGRNISLQNLPRLKSYIELLDVVREYTALQLANTAFSEPTISKKVVLEKDPNCTQQYIDPSVSVVRAGVEYVGNAEGTFVAAQSRAEELRIGITRRMRDILPLPVEGPILPIKDKRSAVVADVHTSDEGILEEGTGVPRVLFVAVKDANGARLTTGFTYSHYEFLSDTRLTDEAWQDNFYTNDGGDYSITYQPKDSWPLIPAWYTELVGTR
ncbi:MAG: DUF3160 domain-containing protein [Minisyncoccia bacterium]